jgi:putative ABC transport system permease protein
MPWYRRLANLMRSDRLGRDIDRELAFHVAERVDELVAAGMSEAEARREARRRFGNPEVMRERVRDADLLVWLESALADLRYAARALRANPGFTLVAVLSLGLGIGANTAIFSLINAVMLRSLPVAQPEELVQLSRAGQVARGSYHSGAGGTIFTNPLWEAVRDRQDALAGTFAFADRSFNLAQAGEVRREAGAWVSGGYFSELGVPAAAGRPLGPADDFRGCPGAAVLGHGFWLREYGGAADAVGRTISLDGHPFEIVGVAAPGFSGVHVGRDAEIFLPLCTADILVPGSDMLDGRSIWYLKVFGRLRPGGTLEEARAGLGAAAQAVHRATIPESWTTEEQREYAEGTLDALPAASGYSAARGDYREALLTLLVVVAVVLLIACANVAQLLMARATAREHEVAVRLAIGSGRARLVRQLLTESLLLALLGAAVGVLFARWASGIVVGLLAQSGRPVDLDLSLDLRVLGFTVAVAAATGILLGLAPAWRSARLDPQAAMHGGGRGPVGRSRQRFARAIVIGQVALSLVLVVASGLLVGSFRRLATLDPGFRSEGVLLVSADWSNADLGEARAPRFPRELLERLRAIPGVRRASASLLTPISGTTWNEYVVVGGYTPPEGQDALIWFNGVTDGYLETFGTPLLAGRDLMPRDGAGAPPVVLINETGADHFFGDESPLGKQIRTEFHGTLGPPMEVVGVVKDAKYRALDEEPLPTAYQPLDQAELWGPAIELALRTEAPPATLIPAVTEAIREVHPAIALELVTLEDQLAVSLARPRLLATLSGFFGVLALALAVIGLYGTIAYSVARRRNEIGIRVALGAARTGILRMVAGEAGRVVAAGVVLGLLLALAATRLVAAFLYGVTASDPATLAISALVLAAAAMAAAALPAWRAAGVDPRVALREE